jgi:hypothetical protein
MQNPKQDVYFIYPPEREPKVQLDRVSMIVRRYRAEDVVFRDPGDDTLYVRCPKGGLGDKELTELGWLVPHILRILRAETGEVL